MLKNEEGHVPDHDVSSTPAPACVGGHAARARGKKDEGGFVLPWFALMLIVLVAMCGFGVDVWNWWYTGQQAQRAADAAALAGVPFMPQNLPQARTTAEDAASRNGYTITDPDVVQGDKQNQLKVTTTKVVQNNFASLLGVKTTTIKRSATAEFNQPLRMGSPQPHLANDPEHGSTDGHWLNLAAASASKHSGDRYTALNCDGDYTCPSGGSNAEYDPNGYFFTFEATSSAAFAIQVYDPEYANQQDCGTNLPSGSDLTTLDTEYGVIDGGAKPTVRWGTGRSIYCPGDDHTGNDKGGTIPMLTTYIVRAPDGTPFDPTDNPVVPGCTKQFTGVDAAFFPLLDSTSGTKNVDLIASLHRWYTMCTIASPTVGKYILQVRSNAPAGDPTGTMTAATAKTYYGHNRYALRAITSASVGTAGVASPNVQVYAEQHLPIYSNAGSVGTTPNFYLAQVLPGGGSSGRTLELFFYDIGDVGGGTANIFVTPPTTDPAYNGAAQVKCTWSANNGLAAPSNGTTTYGSSDCSISQASSANYSSGFNGTLMKAVINVPSGYACGQTNGTILATDCWFRIRMTYSSGAQADDTTTWDATLGGDPVRLIR